MPSIRAILRQYAYCPNRGEINHNQRYDFGGCGMDNAPSKEVQSYRIDRR